MRAGATLMVALLSACGGAPAPREVSRDPGDGHPGAGGAGAAPLEVTLEEIDAPEVDPLEAEESRVVATQVARRRDAEHGLLPQLSRREEGTPDAWPTVTVQNATGHALVVWFSGPCARTVTLHARGEHTVELCEGRYDIAAQLSAADFLPFVGEGEALDNGFGYSLRFYVVAEPRTVRRGGRR